MRIVKNTFLLILVFFIFACANTETVMRNDKGETRYCYLRDDSTIKSIGAVTEYSKCVNDAGTAGFRKVQ